MFGEGYTGKVLEHFRSPANVGQLSNPDGIGEAGDPDRGNFCCFYLRLSGGRIEEVKYRVGGCPNAIAACSAASQWVQGKAVPEAWSISPRVIEDLLEWSPGENAACSRLPVVAVRRAILSALKGFPGQGGGVGTVGGGNF